MWMESPERYPSRESRISAAVGNTIRITGLMAGRAGEKKERALSSACVCDASLVEERPRVWKNESNQLDVSVAMEDTWIWT